MPLYKYYATDKYGIDFRGQMNAMSTAEVISRLKKRKIMPINVSLVKMRQSAVKRVDRTKENAKKARQEYSVDIKKYSQKKQGVAINFSKVKREDVMVFTQNLYLLKKADFNNVQALSTLLENTEKANMRLIIEDILSGVEAGQNMYDIMEFYPSVFPAIFIGIIKSGEQSGNLVGSLESARQYLESSTKLKAKLKSILMPNILQFLFINLLLFAGVIYILPQIDKIYKSFGLTDNLPETTMKFANAINWVVQFWYVFATLIAMGIVILILYIRTPSGKYRWDLLKYKVPVFGSLVMLLDCQKFLNALRLNLQNGMRLQECMEISKDVVKNTVFLSVIESSKNNLILGEDWIEPFERINLFPPMLPEMLKLGMSTDLAEMVSKVEEYIVIDIDRKLEKTIKVLPEISYAFVGIMIVIFVIVIMVPIMEVYMGSFLFDAYL